MLNKIGDIQCEVCGKIRKRISYKHSMCQVCYRKLLDTYSFYGYKTPKEQLKGTELKVCELIVEQNMNRKEVCERLNITKNYVDIIVSKNCFRCDTYGNERPFKIDRKRKVNQ